MNIQQTILLAMAAFFSMGYVHAEDFVMVDMPCYQRNAKGECTSWGGRVRGCKAPERTSCAVSDSFQGLSASCKASAGNSCNAIIPLRDIMNRPLHQTGTTTVKLPCNEKGSQAECLSWWILNQGCIAPIGGTCTTSITDGDRHATCKAESEGSCNSNIKLHG